MKNIREFLKKAPLLFDGAMGTYYKAAPGTECEQANLTDPAGGDGGPPGISGGRGKCHQDQHLQPAPAGGGAHPDWEALAQAGWKLAEAAAGETGTAVFADLGPALDTEALPAAEVYTTVALKFAALGAKNFLFETLSSDAGIAEAARAVREKVPDAFVLVSFAVLPDGYTREECTAGIWPGGWQRAVRWMPLA